MMGDSFAERSKTKQDHPVNTRGGNQHGGYTQSRSHFQETQKDYHKTQGHDDDAKQDVLQALRGKLDRGEHLQDSEELLFQALAKTNKKTHIGAQQEQPHPLEKQPRPSDEQQNLLQNQSHLSDEQQHPLQNQPHPPQQPSHNFQKEQQQQPQWFEKVDSHLLNKDTQDLIRRMGGNIPAPPFMKEDDFNQQGQQQNGAAAANPPGNQDVGNDQNNFEKDQRDEERRLFEMFQGDTHHVKGNANEGDNMDDDKENDEKHEYNNEKEEGNDEDTYNEKDDDYVYGDQKNQVKPAEQEDNALI